MIADMGIDINYGPENGDPIERIFDYVESMRCSLWDLAFFREFKGPDQVHKNKTPEQMPNFTQAVKRVLFRYFKYILYPRKAVSKVPTFFTNYLDLTSSECMYTPAMLKAWDPVHYERCGWYMDCPPKRPPAFDVSLRDSLQPALSMLPGPPPPEDVPPSPPAKRSRGRKGKSGKARVQKRKASELEDDQDEDIPATTVASKEKMEVLPEDRNVEDTEGGKDTEEFSAGREETTQIVKRPHLTPLGVAGPHVFTPPSMKSMEPGHPVSSSRSSTVLVLNDTFPAMMEFKAMNKKFPPSYQLMTSSLTKVTIHYAVFVLY